jgi:WD repeat and SOF domain-containing protein 1
LRTALLNWSESAFHPHSVWQYLSKTKPGLEKLLLRLPDAMFDPAWLNTEYFQRDRPPSPYFKSFDGRFGLRQRLRLSLQIDFFKRPDRSPASKGTASEGFFAGSYAYHYHNNWCVLRSGSAEIDCAAADRRWTPFDPARDFPDMAPREVVPGAVEETPRWSWAAALKREWEGFLRGQLPNMVRASQSFWYIADRLTIGRCSVR